MTEANCILQGHICTACGKTKHPLIEYPFCNETGPTPEEIDRDILSELSELRQKVADMETAKAFQVSYLIILLTA